MNDLEILPYSERYASRVQDLFTDVNRSLAPTDMTDAFENYIQRSIAEEIGRIEAYYESRSGSFWVAVTGETLVGMFGLEADGADAMELRRMYVAPGRRRSGIASRMLAFAETRCRVGGWTRLVLSTSELQQSALSFYRSGGYRLIREEIAGAASNKTIGGGIRRYHFEKTLKEP